MLQTWAVIHRSLTRKCPGYWCLRKASSKGKFERRIFSGIQPTGVPHIGNYIGAIRQWLGLQQEHGGIMLSIVDLHSITVPHEPKQLRKNIQEMAACLIACGINPETSMLFQQSAVSEHAELAWVLGCLTTLPRLQHLPQWKQKSEGVKEVGLGLFTYPVLQSADILLYLSTHVPVGDDQVKHIELTRHLARGFNNKYGLIFPEPKPIVGDFPRIRSLRRPMEKMSKSEQDGRSRIQLTDTPEEIMEKIKKSVTDSDQSITYDPENRPAMSNLIEIYAAFSGNSSQEVEKEWTSRDKVSFKEALSDLLISELSPIRNEYTRLVNEPQHLERLLKAGNDKAKEIAQPVYQRVRTLIGLS